MSLTRTARSRLTRLALLLACVLPLVIAGCTLKSGGYNLSKPAHIRFVNANVDIGTLNITIGSNSPATGLAFEQILPYQNVDPGIQEFKVSVAGGSANVIDSVTTLVDDTNYTYVVYGTGSAPTAQLITDNVNQPGGGLVFINAANFAFGSNGFDVYVTAPGASLDAASPNISNLPYNSVSGAAQFAAGDYRIRLTAPATKQVLYDSGTRNYAERTTYNLLVYSKGSGTLLNVALLQSDAAGSGVVANSSLAQYKVVHAAQGTAPVNALTDGQVTFANVPFLNASLYSGLLAGPHTVAFEAVTAPGATIASARPLFPPATDTTVVLSGAPGAQKAIAIVDDNLPGTAGAARLRFGNVATDLGQVDVLVNFAPRVTRLGASSASGYVELAEDSYTIDFVVSGTATPILTVPALALVAGRTYTLYLTGSSGSAASLFTRDN